LRSIPSGIEQEGKGVLEVFWVSPENTQARITVIRR
jgi:hypothetical protein